jgi:hypothetical protein
VAFHAARDVLPFAQLALEYALKKQPADVWSEATQAEAWLHPGDEVKALDKYRVVIAMSPEKWKLISTGQQTQQIANRLKKRDIEEKLREMFEPETNQLAVGSS